MTSRSCFQGHRGKLVTALWGAGAMLLALGLVAAADASVPMLGYNALLALGLIVWGAAGLWMSISLRPAPEWRFFGALYTTMPLFGCVIALLPHAGATIPTVVLTIALFLDGIVFVLLGMRLGEHLGGAGWMILSGMTGLVAGGLILVLWPRALTLGVGSILAVKFLSAGISLFLAARSARQDAPR
ncbi:DUF308 domain-containing protein [Roseovarius sp. S1116L3]|uniref:DUF308 domain-containing protein n=1 Tax=Roseovarius roseus TaxID=3342636 RepID=UPI00372756BB